MHKRHGTARIHARAILYARWIWNTRWSVCLMNATRCCSVQLTKWPHKHRLWDASFVNLENGRLRSCRSAYIAQCALEFLYITVWFQYSFWATSLGDLWFPPKFYGKFSHLKDIDTMNGWDSHSWNPHSANMSAPIQPQLRTKDFLLTHVADCSYSTADGFTLWNLNSQSQIWNSYMACVEENDFSISCLKLSEARRHLI